jgi:hypothetical protein
VALRQTDYETLRPYATSQGQIRYLDAVKKTTTLDQAAKSLGIQLRVLQNGLLILKRRAALQGDAPAHGLTHPVAPGFTVKGVSTLYGEDGEIKGQWVKTREDDVQREAMMREVVAAMAESIKPVKAQRAPSTTLSDLVNVYVITDFHLGMLSWGEETGADWDVKIAENMLVDWFSAAIAQSPDSELAVFCQLGDMGHWDGMDAVTPASKHLLDADTRFQKLVRVQIRVMRRVIAMLLAKHKKVHVIAAEGNHDPASSVWMRELLSSLYSDEPRITVDLSPDPYYCVEHGSTALFFHHGHKRKPANIETVFAAKFREVFGRTKYAYAHMGHMHHQDIKENNLMIVEQHQTLAAPDAYSSRGGWISDRSAQVITYSKRFGEVGRVRVSSKMLASA